MKPLLAILFDALSPRLAAHGHTVSLDETTVPTHLHLDVSTPVFVHRIVADGEPCFGGTTQQAALLADEVQTVVRMRSGELIGALWEMDDQLTHVGTSRIAAIIERNAYSMRVDHAIGKSDEETHAEAQLSILRYKRQAAQRKATT